MKTVLRILCTLIMMSCVSVYAQDFTTASVEKTYIKCTTNAKGERVPNYYVVVNGVAHQTDSRTFFEVKKARNEEKKNFANRQQNLPTDTKEAKSETLTNAL